MNSHQSPAPRRIVLPSAVVSVLLAASALPLAGQQDLAIDPFAAPVEEVSKLDELHQFLDLHLKLGNGSEAARFANLILAENPNDAEALGVLLGIHLKNNDAGPALSYAKRYRAARPGAEADAMYASALRLNGAKQEALDIMLRRNAKVPKGGHFPQLLELCYCYYDSGKIEEATACFRKVQGDRRFSAKERTEAANQLAAIQREADIREAYLAIEKRDLPRARALVDRVAKSLKQPNRDVIALQAVLDAEQYGKIDDAVAAFQKLKATHKGPEPFPFQSTYSVLLYQQGQYAQAETAAEEAAAEKSPLLTAEEVRGRLDTLRMIRASSRSTASEEASWQSQSEGSAYRGKMVASTPFNKKRTRAGVEYQFNDLNLKKRVPGADQTDYSTAMASLSHQFTPQLRAGIAAGVSGGKFAYRTSARLKRPARDDFVEISFEGRRPTDSLLLETLGAEERRIALKGEAQVPGNRRLRARGEVYLRQIDLNDSGISDLGDGWGARWEAEYLFYQFRRTAVSFAYLGAVDHFNFSDRAKSMAGGLAYNPTALVEDHYHAQGLLVRGRAPLGADLMLSAELGAQFRFDADQMVYSIAGGFEWWVADFTCLDLSGAYYTSGTTAENSSSGYFEGHLGVSSSF